MKKILVVHNTYQNTGGEDIAVKNEVEFLKKHFELDELYFSNKIENFFEFLKIIIFNSNSNAVNKFKKKVNEFNPDIVYVHNTWFNASLGIFNYMIKNNVKFVLKIHNFRYYCTKSIFLKNHIKNKNFCEACGKNRSDNLFFNKYFQESYLKSLMVIRYGTKYFKIIKNNSFPIFVLTNFHKKFLETLGIDSSRIRVLSNYLQITNSKLSNKRENYLVYAGRVSEEKGVKELINSFLNSELKDYKLKIIGEGPILADLKNSNFSKRIEFLGSLTNSETHKIIEKSLCVVSSTKLYEGQPTVLCEASYLGVASVFPNSEGILEFFPDNTKLSFKQYNYSDLVSKLNLLKDQSLCVNEGKKNKDFIIKFLNEDALLSKYKF